MNRRSFFKSLGALAIAPALPALSSPLWGKSVLDIYRIRELQALLNENALTAIDGNYYAIIHPAQWVSVREYAARSAWEDRYRAYRIARRNGGPEKTPQQIMSDWTPPPYIAEELGRVEGFRFITTERVA